MPDFKVKLKMHQINFGWGSAPDLAGAYREGYREGKGRRGRGMQGERERKEGRGEETGGGTLVCIFNLPMQYQLKS